MNHMYQKYTLRTIWGLAKSPELKLSDEELHMIAEAQIAKDSLKDLSQSEMNRLVRYLRNMKDSAEKDSHSKNKGNQSTENQRKKVYKLQQEIGWNEARINGMCKRMFRVSSVRWLNYQQCSKLIEALKNIHKRKEAENG